MGRKRGRPAKSLDGAASAQAMLGAELRRLRQAERLRLADLAQRIGYSAQHVSAVERGAVSASEPFIRACDRCLNAGGHLVQLLDAAIREQAAARHRRSAARRPAPPMPQDGSALDGVDWQRLEAATRSRARPSVGVVQDLALITDRHRSLYHQLPAPQMLACAAAHLSTLQALVGVAADQATGRDCAAMAQETAGLVAWLQHDLGDTAASEGAYRLADELLAASGDRVLAGYVTAFRAVVRSDRGDLRAGDRDLETATDQMGADAPDMPTAWLLALRAEASAQRQDGSSALALLLQAEQTLDRAGDDPGAEWMYAFDHGRLAVHRGSCLLALGRPAEARSAFAEAVGQLPASCVRRRSDLKVKIASAHLAAGDHAGADLLCAEALDGFVSAGSAQGIRTVRSMRRQLITSGGPHAATAVDDRLQALLTHSDGA